MGHILWVEPVFKEMIWGGNQLKEKYGWNRNMTYQHRDNILGKAILLDSYLEEDDK